MKEMHRESISSNQTEKYPQVGKGRLPKKWLPPTIEEIGNAIGRKTPIVHEHLKNLVKGGYLTKDGYIAVKYVRWM